ncbi:hypothetical protein AC579_1790 [Pseudocercospora musae]|uniref:Uncharacterized protein n=1 Tax=Pseudocercospora musae TaxID=113226 RepID=A0A139I0P6_9PEZI|nr:hypothetical protein AC579_1790 [Pseudocercospora musae]
MDIFLNTESRNHKAKPEDALSLCCQLPDRGSSHILLPIEIRATASRISMLAWLAFGKYNTYSIPSSPVTKPTTPTVLSRLNPCLSFQLTKSGINCRDLLLRALDWKGINGEFKTLQLHFRHLLERLHSVAELRFPATNDLDLLDIRLDSISTHVLHARDDESDDDPKPDRLSRVWYELSCCAALASATIKTFS